MLNYSILHTGGVFMATNTISHVGDNLKKFRLERNLSVKSICNALQMPESTYRSYEINARTPSIEQLCEFADFCETSIDQLVGHNVIANDARNAVYYRKIIMSLNEIKEKQIDIENYMKKINRPVKEVCEVF